MSSVRPSASKLLHACCICHGPVVSDDCFRSAHHPLCGRLVCPTCTNKFKESKKIGVCRFPFCIHPAPRQTMTSKSHPSGSLGVFGFPLTVMVEGHSSTIRSGDGEAKQTTSPNNVESTPTPCSPCLIALRILAKKKNKGAPVSPGEVEADCSPATWYCSSCDMSICDDHHDEEHPSSPSSSSSSSSSLSPDKHHVVPVRDHHRIAHGTLVLPHGCLHHHGKTIVVADLTCCAGLCMECYYGSIVHSSHRLLKLHDAMPAIAELIANILLTPPSTPLSPTLSLVNRLKTLSECNTLLQRWLNQLTLIDTTIKSTIQRIIQTESSSQRSESGDKTNQDDIDPWHRSLETVMGTMLEQYTYLKDRCVARIEGMIAQRKGLLTSSQEALRRLTILVPTDITRLHRDSVIKAISAREGSATVVGESLQLLRTLVGVREIVESGDPLLKLTPKALELTKISSILHRLISLIAIPIRQDGNHGERQFDGEAEGEGEKGGERGVNRGTMKGQEMVEVERLMGSNSSSSSKDNNNNSSSSSSVTSSLTGGSNSVSKLSQFPLESPLQQTSVNTYSTLSYSLDAFTLELTNALTPANLVSVAIREELLSPDASTHLGLHEEYTEGTELTFSNWHLKVSENAFIQAQALDPSSSKNTPNTPKNLTKAFQLYKLAEQHNVRHPYLYIRLGDMYQEGLVGTQSNLSQAFAYYYKAAQYDDAQGYMKCGVLLYPLSKEDAIPFLIKAANLGVVDTLLYRYLGEYFLTKGFFQDHSLAQLFCDNVANWQGQLGSCWEALIGTWRARSFKSVELELSRFLDNISLLSATDSRAFVNLFWLSLTSHPLRLTTQDHMLLADALIQRHHPMGYLFKHYLLIIGNEEIPRDAVTAFDILRQAESQDEGKSKGKGDSNSHNESYADVFCALALSYWTGDGVAKNRNEGMNYCNKALAIEPNHPTALSLLSKHGSGTEHNNNSNNKTLLSEWKVTRSPQLSIELVKEEDQSTNDRDRSTIHPPLLERLRYYPWKNWSSLQQLVISGHVGTGISSLTKLLSGKETINIHCGRTCSVTFDALQPVCFVLAAANVYSHSGNPVTVEYSDDGKTYYNVGGSHITDSTGWVIVRWGDRGTHRYWKWTYVDRTRSTQSAMSAFTWYTTTHP